MLKSIQTIMFVGTGLLVKAQCPYTVTISEQDAACHGTATGSAAATINGGTGPFTYAWNTSPVQNGPSVSGIPAGNYTLTVTDGNNCITSTLFTIEEPVSLTADVAPAPLVCAGTPFQVNSVVSGGTQPYTYLWSCTGGNCGIDDPSAAIPTITTMQAGTYFLQVTDVNGCGTSDVFSVNVSSAPVVSVSSDVTIYLGDDTRLTATADKAGSFSWIPGQGLDNAFIADPVASPGSQTTYTVTVVDETGCTGSASVTVYVNTDMVIPTGLTPNGDNLNDTWSVKGLLNFPGIRSEVFNRNGDRVYLGLAGDKGWDGTYNGNALPAGTYFYSIDLGDGSSPISGVLTLIR